MQKALSAAGVLAPQQVEEVAAALYERGEWVSDGIWVRWLFFGSAPNGTLAREFPSVPQLVWDRDVLPFIFQRFHEYHLEKRAHGQWDDDAKGLFSTAAAAVGDVATFIATVNVVDPSARR